MTFHSFRLMFEEEEEEEDEKRNESICLFISNNFEIICVNNQYDVTLNNF